VNGTLGAVPAYGVVTWIVLLPVAPVAIVKVAVIVVSFTTTTLLTAMVPVPPAPCTETVLVGVPENPAPVMVTGKLVPGAPALGLIAAAPASVNDTVLLDPAALVTRMG
jgi:hypothetical protein